jgi:hypothetical protein
MTNSEIERELDAIIAEKVLGLEPCDNWRPINLGSAGGPAMLKECPPTHNCYPRSRPSTYSSNIYAAWSVVEHLARERGWEVTIKVCGQSQEVTIDKREPGAAVVEKAEAETAPMAICLAALRAVAQNVGGVLDDE